ncbi:PhnD/SsuA/transferrin family substrate-binding protein [Hydrogenophilus thiooxidans]|uniref:substrate-binding domain-containing protein n=1 Tax=Hydrogenophilus thiooxidans TaxID=2820326 RepID=UPI001C23FB91|nr:PhnD/SsuA/transferrin family substrate-binding protein [Hydrogenophilus thiooxidans]
MKNDPAINTDMAAAPFSRRTALKALFAQAVGLSFPLPGHSSVDAPLRIGLTPVFLDDQIGFLTHWREWLERKLGQRVQFVQRGSYREVIELLRTSKIDFAWLCGYPYVRYRDELRLVAVPLWRGEPTYYSYLIVDRSQPQLRRLTNLRRKVFAYSDPDSNSGFLYPQYAIAQSGENPAKFFARTFFTWAHRKVIEAVAAGLAAGGAVDGYVWEMLAEIHPQLVQGTQIIERSPPFGFPPFVANKNIPEALETRFRTALLNMADDANGAQLLRLLRLDGFTTADDTLYDSIAWMAAYLNLPRT